MPRLPRRYVDSGGGADLKATGILDDRTVKALNSPKRDRQIDTVIVNMERWRWLRAQLAASSLGNATSFSHPGLYAQGDAEWRTVWNTRSSPEAGFTRRRC